MPREKLFTGESEDEQRPVLVSSHPPPKIGQKLPFTETWTHLPPNMLHSFPEWQKEGICQMHFFKINYTGPYYKAKGFWSGREKSKFQLQTQTSSWDRQHFCRIQTTLLSIYQYTLLFQPNPILDTRISVCLFGLCHALGTPTGFWKRVDWRDLVED